MVSDRSARRRHLRGQRALHELKVLHALGALEQLRIGALHALGGRRQRNQLALIAQQQRRVLFGARPVRAQAFQRARRTRIACQSRERGDETVAARLDLRKGLGVPAQPPQRRLGEALRHHAHLRGGGHEPFA
jgi:hypothetical protein